MNMKNFNAAREEGRKRKIKKKKKGEGTNKAQPKRPPSSPYICCCRRHLSSGPPCRFPSPSPMPVLPLALQIPLHSMQIKSFWPATAPLTSLMLQLAGEESWHGHRNQWGWGGDKSLAFSSSSSFFSLTSSLVLLDFGRSDRDAQDFFNAWTPMQRLENHG